jgi:hypothetical protein
MKFYTVIFEENGETVSIFSIHAKSELEAKLAAERYFRDDSELSKLLGNEEVNHSCRGSAACLRAPKGASFP